MCSHRWQAITTLISGARRGCQFSWRRSFIARILHACAQRFGELGPKLKICVVPCQLSALRLCSVVHHYIPWIYGDLCPNIAADYRIRCPWVHVPQIVADFAIIYAHPYWRWQGAALWHKWQLGLNTTRDHPAFAHSLSDSPSCRLTLTADITDRR